MLEIALCAKFLYLEYNNLCFNLLEHFIDESGES